MGIKNIYIHSFHTNISENNIGKKERKKKKEYNFFFKIKEQGKESETEKDKYYTISLTCGI